MTDERLAQIERLLVDDERCYGADPPTIKHRRELLDEVKRLQGGRMRELTQRDVDDAREQLERAKRESDEDYLSHRFTSLTKIFDAHDDVYALLVKRMEKDASDARARDVQLFICTLIAAVIGLVGWFR